MSPEQDGFLNTDDRVLNLLKISQHLSTSHTIGNNFCRRTHKEVIIDSKSICIRRRRRSCALEGRQVSTRADIQCDIMCNRFLLFYSNIYLPLLK